MNEWVEITLVLSALMSMALLATSRLGTCIRLVAAQGAIVGVLPVLLGSQVTMHTAFLAVSTIALKGMVFPRVLQRTLRDGSVRREVEPYCGYGVSVLFGLLTLAASFWLSSRLPLPGGGESSLIAPISFFNIAIGMFVIVSRHKALTQVLGYLVMENGIYSFGMALAIEQPILVEMGVLLDVFVAVFVMGITIFHISREFDDIDVNRLATLSEINTPGRDA